MGKLYITDLDGTFLLDNKEIPPKAPQVLHQLRKKGHFFSVATSRHVEACQKLLQKVEITEPVISSDGVFIADIKSGNRLDCQYLTQDDTVKILEMGHLHGITPFMFVYDESENILFDSIEPEEKKKFFSTRKNDHRMKKVKNLDNYTNTNVMSINFMGKQNLIQKLKEGIMALGLSVNILYYRHRKWGETFYLKITHQFANKKHALERLIKVLGITLKDVIAFGNDINDYGMLEISGTSCAVDNAIPQLKKICDKVIDNNNNVAVISYLERNL